MTGISRQQNARVFVLAGEAQGGFQMQATRSGFSLTELLISIGIVSVLLALLVPAVQSARASARLVQCRSNLRQIGIAFHNFADARNELPTTTGAFEDLRPYLESPPSVSAPSVFVCPADSRTRAQLGEVNYHLNSGTEFYLRPDSRYIRDGNGILSRLQNRPLSEISDGLSNTACFAERLCAGSFVSDLTEAELRSDPKRFIWFLPEPNYGAGREEEFAAACRERRVSPFPGILGTNSFFSEWFPGYNHFVTPNSTPCVNGSLQNAIDVYIVPATSNHAGGATVLLCDGSVRYINESIDTEVWKAVGSRDGSDVMSLEW